MKVWNPVNERLSQEKEIKLFKDQITILGMYLNY